MKLIVGLGNPGNEYKLTRHNIGFMVVDRLSIDENLPHHTKKFKSFLTHGPLFGCKVIIAKPSTFMNLSGEAVGTIAAYYGIAAEDIIVIHDDMDIEFGQLKIKTKGGAAGHRGIESIIKYLKNEDFVRVRIGIGKPPPYISGADFVLQKFNSAEQEELMQVIGSTENCIEALLKHGPETAMNRFHSINKTVR